MKRKVNASNAIVLSSLALMLITVFLKILGFAEKRVLGHYYGTGDEHDAFLTALKIGLLVFFVFRGILQPVVIPLLTTAKNHSLARSRTFGFSIALFLIFSAGLLILIGEIYTPQIVQHYASGFSDTKRELCVRLTRWLLPAALIMSLTGLLEMSFKVQKRFALAALGACVQRALFILLLLLWVAPFGFEWIAGAYWSSALLLLALFSLYHLRKFQIFEQLGFSSKMLARAALLGWPLIIGSAISEYGRLKQNDLASTIDGAITAISFAKSTIDLPLILVPFSLSIVLFTYFCEFSDKKDFQRSTGHLFHAARYLLLLFVPAALYTLLFREDIAHLLWKSGKFGPESVKMTAEALLGLAPGLPFFALEMILMTFFFSRKKTILPVVCGALATFIAIALLPHLKHHFQLTGVAAYLSVARAFKLAFLLYCLRFLDIRLPWRSAGLFLIKLSLALIPALASHALCARFLYPRIPLFQQIPFLPFAASTLILAAIYLGALYSLHFPECDAILKYMKEKLLSHSKRRTNP